MRENINYNNYNDEINDSFLDFDDRWQTLLQNYSHRELNQCYIYVYL